MKTTTPDSSLPPLGEPPFRKMLIEIEVSANFEKRLDNQWMIEREINADRWSWRWADEKNNEAFSELPRNCKDAGRVAKAGVVLMQDGVSFSHLEEIK